MPLKFKAKTTDEIPPEYQPLYVARDGVWILDVDGTLDKSDFHESRHRDGTLLNQIEAVSSSAPLCHLPFPWPP